METQHDCRLRTIAAEDTKGDSAAADENPEGDIAADLKEDEVSEGETQP